MQTEAVLQKLLKSYQRYYDVREDGVEPPFVAEADFSLQSEQFFIVKTAKLSESDSKEFVYFAVPDRLSAETLAQLDRLAWERGLAKIKPHSSHKNSDVHLIILTQHIDDDAAKLIKKTHHYKSYKMTINGWSHYKLIAADLSTGEIVCNRQGSSLKKHLGNIINSFSEGENK